MDIILHLNIYNLLNRFTQQLDKLAILKKDEKLLLALSGGVDSMVLVDLITRLGFSFGIAHVDHNTRNGESKLDRDFVADFADANGVPFHETNLVIEDGNFHDEAHRARYDFFNSLPYDWVVTAHHKDDAVETVFINFLNGRSLESIISHHNIIRPLLPFSKEDILQYAEQNGIAYRTDSSNEKNDYLRNLIRNELHPRITNLLPHYHERILGLSKRNDEDGQLLRELVARDREVIISALQGDVAEVKLGQLKTFGATYLFHLLTDFGINRAQALDLRRLINGDNNKGKQILTDSHSLIMGKEKLVIAPLGGDTLEERRFQISDLPERFSFGQSRFVIQRDYYLDRKANQDELLLPEAHADQFLTIRTWKNGDSIEALGMNGQSKTLKKIFADAHLAINEKSQVPLFLLEDKIVWVSGLAVAESCRQEPGTPAKLIRIQKV